MVLYVFVVAYVGGGEELRRPARALRILGPLFALALAVELCIAMLGSALKGISGKGAPVRPRLRHPAHIGTLFLTTYLFPFEVASLLLLVAAVGAVVLARRRRGLEPDEDRDRRLSDSTAGLHRDDGRGRRQPQARSSADRPEPARPSRSARAGPQSEGGW